AAMTSALSLFLLSLLCFHDASSFSAYATRHLGSSLGSSISRFADFLGIKLNSNQINCFPPCHRDSDCWGGWCERTCCVRPHDP
ncbi:hypothetical protein PMAYCL1PPCAC_27270, partial [Pristionchus mayeri]